MKSSGIADRPAVHRRPGNSFAPDEFASVRRLQPAVNAPAAPAQAAKPPPSSNGKASVLDDALAGLDLTPSPEPIAETAGPSSVGKLVDLDSTPVWIHCSKMKVWTHNPRHVLDEDKLLSLGNSIREYGQNDPVDCFEDPENAGEYLILGGQRRWTIISRLNLQEGMVLAKVRPGAPPLETLFAAAIETQANTDPLTDLDFAISLSKSSDTIGVRALSRYIKKSASEISKLRQIGLLPDDVLDAMKLHANKLSYSFGYEVVQVNDALGSVAAKDFVKTIVSKNLSVKSTISARETLLGDRQSFRRSAWSTVRLNYNGQQAGQMRTRDDTGEIDLKLKSLNAEQMEILRQAVNDVLREQQKA